jgi:hypothetical protein
MKFSNTSETRGIEDNNLKKIVLFAGGLAVQLTGAL